MFREEPLLSLALDLRLLPLQDLASSKYMIILPSSAQCKLLVSLALLFRRGHLVEYSSLQTWKKNKHSIDFYASLDWEVDVLSMFTGMCSEGFPFSLIMAISIIPVVGSFYYSGGIPNYLFYREKNSEDRTISAMYASFNIAVFILKTGIGLADIQHSGLRRVMREALSECSYLDKLYALVTLIFDGRYITLLYDCISDHIRSSSFNFSELKITHCFQKEFSYEVQVLRRFWIEFVIYGDFVFSKEGIISLSDIRKEAIKRKITVMVDARFPVSIKKIQFIKKCLMSNAQVYFRVAQSKENTFNIHRGFHIHIISDNDFVVELIGLEIIDGPFCALSCIIRNRTEKKLLFLLKVVTIRWECLNKGECSVDGVDRLSQLYSSWFLKIEEEQDNVQFDYISLYNHYDLHMRTNPLNLIDYEDRYPIDKQGKSIFYFLK